MPRVFFSLNISKCCILKTAEGGLACHRSLDKLNVSLASCVIKQSPVAKNLPVILHFMDYSLTQKLQCLFHQRVSGQHQNNLKWLKMLKCKHMVFVHQHSVLSLALELILNISF